MIKPTVIIIMSTYNGERFIEQQLESLLQQTYHCQIILRDDGSTDHTVKIVDHYTKNFSNISRLKDDTLHKGLRESYLCLLNYAMTFNPDYICYADQDDVWLPDKTQKLLSTMQAHEIINQPTLVFSDVKVVDENLHEIHSSLSQLQKLHNNEKISLKKLLFYCPALGCAIMLNKALIHLISAYSIYGKTLHHDKWALILAQLCGRIIYLPECTLLYRQHSANTVGAMLGIQRNAWTLKNIHFLKQRYRTALIQAKDITELPFISASDKKTVQQFMKVFVGSYINRLRHYLLFLLTPPSWKRKVGLAMSLFLRYEDEHA